MSLNAMLYVPKSYYETDREFPLILFLHGIAERGSDLELVHRDGLPRLLNGAEDFPFLVLSPQCPAHSHWVWHVDELEQVLDETLEKFRVDASRVYLTGISMGGYGAWHLAACVPWRFAALAPICGGGNPHSAERLRDLPTWTFHGELDRIVPISESQAMVHALRQTGGDIRFTVYEGVEHDCWTRTYTNPKLYEWMLHHRRV